MTDSDKDKHNPKLDEYEKYLEENIDKAAPLSEEEKNEPRIVL